MRSRSRPLRSARGALQRGQSMSRVRHLPEADLMLMGDFRCRSAELGARVGASRSSPGPIRRPQLVQTPMHEKDLTFTNQRADSDPDAFAHKSVDIRLASVHTCRRSERSVFRRVSLAEASSGAPLRLGRLFDSQLADVGPACRTGRERAHPIDPAVIRGKATVGRILNDLNEAGARAHKFAHGRARSEPERLHMSSVNGGNCRRLWLLRTVYER